MTLFIYYLIYFLRFRVSYFQSHMTKILLSFRGWQEGEQSEHLVEMVIFVNHETTVINNLERTVINRPK